MNNMEKYIEAIKRGLDLSNYADVERAERGITENWDSIGHMTLVGEIEDVFSIMMDPEDILNFKTYEDGIEILKKNGIKI